MGPTSSKLWLQLVNNRFDDITIELDFQQNTDTVEHISFKIYENTKRVIVIVVI